MNERPTSTNKWGWAVALLIVAVTAGAGISGIRSLRALESELAAPTIARLTNEQLVAQARQGLAPAATDAWTGQMLSRLANRVYLNQGGLGELNNMRNPLQQLRDARRAQMWLLLGKLVQLDRAGQPPEAWWPAIGQQVTLLADRPPALGLGALLSSANATYREVGLDPIAASQVAEAHYGPPMQTSVMVFDTLLQRAAERIPEHAPLIERLHHNLLAQWLQEDGAIHLQLLVAEKLSALYERRGQPRSDLNAWRAACRATLESHEPTVLGATSNPTPEPAAQRTWVNRLLQALWLEYALYGLLGLAAVGLFWVGTKGVALAHVALALVACVLVWFGVQAFSFEQKWYSFRLGYPTAEPFALAPYAIAVGALLPFLIGASLRKPGWWQSGLITSSLTVALLATMLMVSAGQVGSARQGYLDAAAPQMADRAGSLAGEMPIPRVRLEVGSE